MTACAVLDELRSVGLSVSAAGGQVVVAPRRLLTDPLRQAIRDHKPQVLAELEREACQERRRQQVIEMLRRRPEIRYAYIAESQFNGDGVVMLGIRDVGTGELTIPAANYDPLQVAVLLDAAIGESPS